VLEKARVAVLAALSVLVVALALGKPARPSEDSAPAPSAQHTEPTRPADPTVVRLPQEPLALLRTQAPAAEAQQVPAARTAADVDAPEHPHPITQQHEERRAQQQLVSALNDALDQQDAVGLRALIERYDALSPEDPQRLAEGYERAADCIEASDPVRRTSARANAQRYYDDARASSLRRYIRRLCLEPKP